MSEGLATRKKRLSVLCSPEKGGPPVWHVVEALPFKFLRPGWEDARLAAYRRGEVCFVFHIPTGLNCACASSIERARVSFEACVKDLTFKEFESMMRYAFFIGNYPPKPENI
jgi:hypothetical protein